MKAAHQLATQDDVRRDLVDAGFFGKILQPALQECSPALSRLIDEEILVDDQDPAMTAGYPSLKAKLEATYACLGITCEDVGGLLDLDTHQWHAGAEPCGLRLQASLDSDKGSLPTWAIVLFVALALVCSGCIGLACYCVGFRRGKRYERFDSVERAMDRAKESVDAVAVGSASGP